MEPIYITINHLEDYCMERSLKPGMPVMLQKEENNPYDDEAITVKTKQNVKIGYVANSTGTVARGTYSAGRLYDKIDDKAEAIVRFSTSDLAIAELCEFNKRNE